jgi:hypothetical protein
VAVSVGLGSIDLPDQGCYWRSLADFGVRVSGNQLFLVRVQVPQQVKASRGRPFFLPAAPS